MKNLFVDLQKFLEQSLGEREILNINKNNISDLQKKKDTVVQSLKVYISKLKNFIDLSKSIQNEEEQTLPSVENSLDKKNLNKMEGNDETNPPTLEQTRGVISSNQEEKFSSGSIKPKESVEDLNEKLNNIEINKEKSGNSPL